MMPADWHIARALEQLSAAKEHDRWARYYRAFGNAMQEQAQLGQMTKCLAAAELFIKDAINAMKGGEDDQ